MGQRTEQQIAAEKDGISIAYILMALGLIAVFATDTSPFLRGYCVASMVISLMLSYAGRERKIGFFKAFLLSSVFSPVIGIIFIFTSPRLKDEEYKERMLQATAIRPDTPNIADQLQKLNELRKEGVLTDEEFENQKHKLLNA
jgi:hypothetical protein